MPQELCQLLFEECLQEKKHQCMNILKLQTEELAKVLKKFYIEIKKVNVCLEIF